MSGAPSLLDPAFRRRLEGLRLLVRRRFAGGSPGARQSRRRGSSVEFAAHRPYAPGDDVRRIDWNAYARLEELAVRLYVAEEDLHLYLLVDTSRSLGFGEPPKIEVAKRIAAALAYVALSSGERISVVPFAAGLAASPAPMRGRGRIGTALRALDVLQPKGETDLRRSVGELLARRARRGVVVVLSDLLDRGGYQRPLDRLLAERFELTIFHVLSREELDPGAGGDVRLVDSEAGTVVDVSLDARALAAYQARLDTFLQEARTYARRRGIGYVPVLGDVAWKDALLDYLRGSDAPVGR